MKQEVLVSVDFLRHLEAELSDYAEKIDGEWGNGRTVEQLDEAHLLPEEVYQIRQILKESVVFGNQVEHKSGKPLHHFALVLRDLDKTIDGWCEDPEFYLNGERIYAPPVSVEAAVLAERKACADLCSRIGVGCLTSGVDLGPWDCAEQILARGDK